MKELVQRVIQAFQKYDLSLLGLALFSVAYVFGSAHFLGSKYLDNDNIGILEYARHGLPINYTGTLLIESLHLAYTLAPDVPWYGLGLYAAHVLSVFLWLWLFFRVLRPWWVACIFDLVFLGYYSTFLMDLDYTSTAAMLCASSLTWVLLDVMERRAAYLRFLGAGVIFALGWQARPQAPLGSLAYILPVALLVVAWCLRERPLGKEARRSALIAVVFFAPIVASMAADAAYRHFTLTPQQAQFDAFDSLLGKLQTGLSGSRKQAIIRDRELLDSIHWTHTDAVHMFSWAFLDERIYTTGALQSLLDNAPPRTVSLRDLLDAVIKRLTPNPVLLLLLCSIPFPLLLLRKHPWLAGLGLAGPVYCIALSSFMSLFFVYGSRTETPFVLGFGFSFLVISAALVARSGHIGKKSFLPIALVGAALGCVGAYSAPQLQLVNLPYRSMLAEATRETIAILNRDYAGAVIVTAPQRGLPLAQLSPLETYELRFHPVLLGWNTFSPLFYRQISPLGIQHGYQLVDALIADPNAYILGTEYWCRSILSYASNSSKRQLSVVKIRNFSNNTIMYRLEEIKK